MTGPSGATAQVFAGAGLPFDLRRVPLPAPGPGERLVRIVLATICGSDLHTIEGRRIEPTPAILGHEGIGVVERAGVGAESDVGRRVTWTIADSCGQCRPCHDWGLPQKCDHLFKYGHAELSDGCGLNGTYASHVLLRSGTHVVAVPEGVPDHAAAPANCALATAVAAVEQVDEEAERVLVQGAGLLGVYAAALLVRRGVHVVCSDPIIARRDLVAQWGAESVSPGQTENLTGLDAVIEISGVPGCVPQGVAALRVGGTYVFVGMVHPDSALPLTGETVIRRCLRIVGIHNYAPRHLDEAMRFLAELGDDPRLAQLVSPPHDLNALAAAVEAARGQSWHRVSVRSR